MVYKRLLIVFLLFFLKFIILGPSDEEVDYQGLRAMVLPSKGINSRHRPINLAPTTTTIFSPTRSTTRQVLGAVSTRSFTVQIRKMTKQVMITGGVIAHSKQQRTKIRMQVALGTTFKTQKPLRKTTDGAIIMLENNQNKARKLIRTIATRKSRVVISRD